MTEPIAKITQTETIVLDRSAIEQILFDRTINGPSVSARVEFSLVGSNIVATVTIVRDVTEKAI